MDKGRRRGCRRAREITIRDWEERRKKDMHAVLGVGLLYLLVLYGGWTQIDVGKGVERRVREPAKGNEQTNVGDGREEEGGR